MVTGSILKCHINTSVFAYDFELESTANSVSKISKKNAWSSMTPSIFYSTLY